MELVQRCSKGGATYEKILKLPYFRLMRNNTEGALIDAKHGSPRIFSDLLFSFLFITKAQAVESNTGLGHAWQKIVRLLTGGRGIRSPDESLPYITLQKTGLVTRQLS